MPRAVKIPYGLSTLFPSTQGGVLNKRSIPFFIVSCVLFVIGGLAYFMPTSEEPLPNRILLQNAGGRVVFDHTLHGSIAGVDCASCHHEMNITGEQNPESVMKCGACHISPTNTTFATTHQALYDAKDGGKSCITCHHMDEAADSTELGSVVGKDFQSCSSCHPETPNRMDAFHKNCMGCHDELAKGPRTESPCAQCHTSK